MKREAEIEKGIRAYLRRHPEAHDTLEGIVEWWLLDQQIRQTLSSVEQVLRKMVANGELEIFQGRDGRVHYRVMKEPKPELRPQKPR